MTRFATWNVNSLKVRQERIEQWLTDIAPDIVCMQETKIADDAFPQLAFEAMGYTAAHHGEGRWNGVAILSRQGLDDVRFGFADGGDHDAEARLMTARCGGITVVTVYVPNGRSLDSDHYQYKLSWLDRLAAHLDKVAAPGDPVIVAGDFNIAPTDVDVYDPAVYVGATHVSEPERSRLDSLEERGLVDVFRHLHPDAPRVFSWWDYRRGDFHEGRGMRIDLVLASEPVIRRTEWCIIDRNARKGQQPSDHAPVVVDLAD
jgi:exodeoxyribonuclease-3